MKKSDLRRIAGFAVWAVAVSMLSGFAQARPRNDTLEIEANYSPRYYRAYAANGGVNLYDRKNDRVLVTGYGTGGSGVWAITTGEVKESILPPERFIRPTAREECRNTEVPIGVNQNGVLLCQKMEPGYRLADVKDHVGAWGKNITQSCPRDQVMVGWKYPNPDYTVNYVCASIVKR